MWIVVFVADVELTHTADPLWFDFCRVSILTISALIDPVHFSLRLHPQKCFRPSVLRIDDIKPSSVQLPGQIEVSRRSHTTYLLSHKLCETLLVEVRLNTGQLALT